MKSSTLVHVVSLAFLGNLPLAGQSTSGGKDADLPVREAAPLPPGWTARPDAGGDAGTIKFVTMEPGYHLTLGPATILYRKEDRANGPFHTLAKFHQMKQLKHAEGYGLFLGGQNLEGKGQSYTYFLVRADGKFTIKRRDGDQVTELVDWTLHPAINKASAEGKATNLLEIDAKVDPKRVSFKANGKEVHWVPAGKMAITGTVGLRVNHNLDLHVEDFAVHQ
jgi:hypothetical protein